MARILTNLDDLRKCAEMIRANMENETAIKEELDKMDVTDVINEKTAELKEALEKYMTLSEEYAKIIFEVADMWSACDYGSPRSLRSFD